MATSTIRRKWKRSTDVPHLRQHAMEVAPPSLPPQLQLARQVRAMVHRIVQVPVPQQDEPEFVGRPNVAVVTSCRAGAVACPDGREVVVAWDGKQGELGDVDAPDFVVVRRRVDVVPVAIDERGGELVCQTEDRQPTVGQVDKWRSDVQAGSAHHKRSLSASPRVPASAYIIPATLCP